jgi:hypothetical protein
VRVIVGFDITNAKTSNTSSLVFSVAERERRRGDVRDVERKRVNGEE